MSKFGFTEYAIREAEAKLRCMCAKEDREMSKLGFIRITEKTEEEKAYARVVRGLITKYE